jgi:glycine cleavage system aminomethyltransferase T
VGALEDLGGGSGNHRLAADDADARHVERKLAGVEIAGAGLGAYNDGAMVDFFPVSHRDERVGQVTSGCHSPRLAKNIGYAMLPIELAELGTELEVEVAGARRHAVVVQMPFIDPKKEIPKQRLATEH